MCLLKREYWSVILHTFPFTWYVFSAMFKWTGLTTQILFVGVDMHWIKNEMPWNKRNSKHVKSSLSLCKWIPIGAIRCRLRMWIDWTMAMEPRWNRRYTTPDTNLEHTCMRISLFRGKKVRNYCILESIMQFSLQETRRVHRTCHNVFLNQKDYYFSIYFHQTIDWHDCICWVLSWHSKQPGTRSGLWPSGDVRSPSPKDEIWSSLK